MAVVGREKLYEQVWTIPGARLAPLYGISDVALAKVCKRHKIPRPPRGYWARLAAGQKPRKTPLPKLRDGSPFHILGWNMPDEVYEVNAAIPPGVAQKPSTVTEPPPSPHELVASAQTQLAAAKADQNGLLRTDPASALEVCVSVAAMPRCLALFESLIRKWDARGGSVRVTADGGGRTGLVMGEDELYVRIVEEVDASKPVSDLTRLTGRLSAQLHGPNIGRQWADRKTQRLEKIMGTLVATAADTLQREKAVRLDRECVQRQEQRVEELRAAAEQAHNTEFWRRQKLMEHANRWRDAERIRGYLSAVQTAIQENKARPIDEARFREWFEWAELYANSIDPILQAKLPEEAPQGPTNKPLAELDLTSLARATTAELNVKDSDDLSRINRDQLRERYGYFNNDMWNEFARVLEALGYDVAKRERPWY